MKNTYRLIIFLLCVTFSFQAFSQSARLRQLADDTGISVSASAPADTTVTWRKTTDGKSYFWDVETQEWKEIKYNYDFLSYSNVLNSNIPLNSIIQTPFKEYTVLSDSINGVSVDSIFVVPLSNNLYAVDKRLIDENVIEITNDLIGDTTQNNYVLNKASEIGRQLSVAQKSSTIILPAKFIEYTNQWNVTATYSGTSISIKGTGKSNNGSGRTTLKYLGSDSAAVYISDMGNCLVEDLNIITTSKFAVYIDTFIFKVYFRNTDFSATDSTTHALVELNRYTNSQISEINFDNCRFAGGGGGNNLTPGAHETEYGIIGGLANNKGLYIWECQFLNIDTAIHYGGGGILDLQKNNFANNYVDIFAGGNRTFCTSNYSEAARRFYVSSIFSGMATHTLRNNYFAGQPVDNIVIWGGGYLTLIGNSFDGGSDSLHRIKWDIPTNNTTISTTGFNNSRKILSIGNFFKNCTNTPGEKWLINGVDAEPSNVSRMVKSWSNRGGINDSNGIYLDDYFSFWETYSNGIEYNGSWSGAPGTNVLISNANMSIQNWGSGYGLAVGSSSTITPAIFSGLNGSIAVGTNGRSQMDFNSASGQVPLINLSENGTNYLFLGQKFTSQPTITAPVNHLTVFVDGNNDGVGNLYFRKGSINGRTSDGTGLAILTNGGNFGIGTMTTVSEKLEVSGNCVIDGAIYLNTAKTLGIFTGTGTPEGAITAAIGSTFHRTDGGASTSYYVKESGSGNTGWVAK